MRFIPFILIVCLSACTTNVKKYYYVEGEKEEKVIEAISDSAAYMEAFKYFEISKKIYEDMKSTYGRVSIERPFSFKLLNDKRQDITYSVDFSLKDSLEKIASDRISSRSNVIEDAVQRAREKRNGIGAKYDTAGLHLAPVKILNAKFINKEYSNYKDVSLRFKNVSSKKIAAIRFKWYGENAFNEPADMGALSNGWGSGFSDDALRPGAIDYGVWNVFSKDGRKILIAYPYEVAFEDGTKWALPDN